MQVAKDAAALAAALEGSRKAGKRIGLVATMGALHAGHSSLVRAARAKCDVVVASIFVNPTQFGPTEDLAAYPRDPDGDRMKLADWGCGVLFLPTVDTMYPAGTESVRVMPPAGLMERLCGPTRPVHFPGVLTVVLKLFQLVRPHAAFFGQKDYQQWRVIAHMAADLLTGVEIVRCPTVREADGLAMSSRNAYLTPDQRAQAVALSRALAAALDRYRAGERDVAALRHSAMSMWLGLTEDEADKPDLEYLEVLDGDTLAPVPRLDGAGVAAIAARVGKARLIDNAILSDDSDDLGLLDLTRGTLFSRLA
ncbi:MAG: pantoate--beta-alanine ligase [Candidatus Sericytochromatia bacterium]|uniref:Pantothenate synthetase n=1 Tax=Candidatus Tanganyikabacteria bacterium TaxID=2961651 RepID=A0A937X569_9BACT|nr:pantoate--beta-alanine ligase [Candidatus Tanganyikabacteria bacterium]